MTLEKMEDSPEFKAALAEECERQYRGYLYGGDYAKASSSKDTIAGTMEEIQKQRAKIESEVAEARLHAERVRREAEIMSNPHAREITENLRRLHSVEGSLVCPKCRETDSHGNRMNGRPYCFRCQIPMVSKEKAEKWVKPKPKKETFLGYNYPEDRMIKRR